MTTYDSLFDEVISRSSDECPSEKGRRHDWVGQRAYDLIVRHGLSVEEARSQLIRETRRVPRERNIRQDIDEGIRTAVLKRDGRQAGRMKTPRTPRWNEPDIGKIRTLNDQYSRFTYQRLIEDSPVHSQPELTAQRLLLQLFKPEMLVCCGRAKADPGEIYTAQAWARSRVLPDKSLIVPNPMAERWRYEGGKLKKTPSGKPSVRLLENVLSRRYLPIEWDQIEDCDVQARLIYHLAHHMPLVMVVNGARPPTNHAWYNCVGQPGWRIEQFFNDACSLGADPRHWSLNQYCRLPGGFRNEIKEGRHIRGYQKVIYFNPDKLPKS